MFCKLFNLLIYLIKLKILKMKTTFSIFFSIFFSITLFAQLPKVPSKTTAKENSINYFNDDPNFKINFFGITPSKTETPVETALGTINMTSYMYEKSTEEVYMVAISAFPEAYMKSSDIDELLENTKNGFCNNLNLTVTKSNRISIDSYPGIYFEAEQKGSYHSAVSDYLIGNVLYQIAILRADRMPTQKEIDEFIFSFSLK